MQVTYKCLFHYILMMFNLCITCLHMILNPCNDCTVCYKSTKCGGDCACSLTEPQQYPCFINNMLSIFYYHAGQLFNIYTWSVSEASLNSHRFKAALASMQQIMGLSVVCGSAPTILFSTTGRGEGAKVKVVTQPCVRI